MFCPNGPTRTITLVGGVSQSISLTSPDIEGRAIRIFDQNGSSFMSFSASASSADMPTFVNSPEIFRVPAGVTEVSFFSASGPFIIVTEGQEL